MKISENHGEIWKNRRTFAEILRFEQCKSCRSRQELSNEYFLAKFGFDTADNEPDTTPPRDLIFTYVPRTRGAGGGCRGGRRGRAPRRAAGRRRVDGGAVREALREEEARDRSDKPIWRD